MTANADKTDQATAAQWFERWHALIRHALSGRLQRKEDVDDMAQEVYLRLLRVRDLDLVRSPRSYLYRIAVNVAEEWRLRAPQAWDHSAPLDALEADEEPEKETELEQRDAAVQSALAKLPLAARTALVLQLRDGLTYEQIAEHMGVTRRAVKRYVANGYAELRQELEAFQWGQNDDRKNTKDDSQHGER